MGKGLQKYSQYGFKEGAMQLIKVFKDEVNKSNSIYVVSDGINTYNLSYIDLFNMIQQGKQIKGANLYRNKLRVFI